MSRETTPEQAQEWLNNPVTQDLLEEFEKGITELQEVPRFRLYETINNGVTIPTTADMCALKNAYQEGRIDALREITEAIRGNAKDES